MLLNKCLAKGRDAWARSWMSLAGVPIVGRVAMAFASSCQPPYRGRVGLARLHRRGFISPSARLHHAQLRLGKHIFIGDRVLIYQVDATSGPVELGDRVRLHREVIIETGAGGSLKIGQETNIQPHCLFSAYQSPIRIGCGVSIAPHCAFYPYDHGIAPDKPIRKQPLRSRGGIIIEDEVWIGFGVIVLDGVHVGHGAVLGAGSVVTHDVPAEAVVHGFPARVLMMRSELPPNNSVPLAVEHLPARL